MQRQQTAVDGDLLDVLGRSDPARDDPPPEKGSARYAAIIDAATGHRHGEQSRARAPERRSRRMLRAAAAALVAAVAMSVVVSDKDATHDVSGVILAAAHRTGELSDTQVELWIEGDDRSRIRVIGESDATDSGATGPTTPADSPPGGVVTIPEGDAYSIDIDGKTSIERAPGELTSFNVASEAVLSAVLAAADGERVGSGVLGGSRAEHYRVELGPQAREALWALTDAERAWFEIHDPDDLEAIDVWVAEGLIREVRLTSGSGSVTARYYRLDAEITIDVPSGE